MELTGVRAAPSLALAVFLLAGASCVAASYNYVSADYALRNSKPSSASPEILARLRDEWFVPQLEGPADNRLLHETYINGCGTKGSWKVSGRQAEVDTLFKEVSKESLQRYQPLRILGHGTQGVVILAKDMLQHRLVAIKEAGPQTTAKEVRILQAVQGSVDIMKLHDVLMPKHLDTKLSCAFIVLERLVLPLYEMHLMWGHSVIHTVPSKTLKHVLFNIVRGVHYLHTNGIAHLDLKPDNVMISEGCEPRIVDLGISKALYGPDGEELHTAATSLKHGSRAPEYAMRSWEKLRSLQLGPDMAKASDLWSLGVVLLTALNGGDVIAHYKAAADLKHSSDLDVFAYMLGRPSEKTLGKYYGRDAAKRLLPLSKSPHMSLEEAFPRCDRDALKMVERLLRMDPSARASTRDILLDPYFADIRSSKNHKDWMADNLVPNPRVLELIHSKAALVKSSQDNAKETIVELALAYSPAAEAAWMRLNRTGSVNGAL